MAACDQLSDGSLANNWSFWPQEQLGGSGEVRRAKHLDGAGHKVATSLSYVGICTASRSYGHGAMFAGMPRLCRSFDSFVDFGKFQSHSLTSFVTVSSICLSLRPGVSQLAHALAGREPLPYLPMTRSSPFQTLSRLLASRHAPPTHRGSNCRRTISRIDPGQGALSLPQQDGNRRVVLLHDRVGSREEGPELELASCSRRPEIEHPVTYLVAELCSPVWQKRNRSSFRPLAKAYLPDILALCRQIGRRGFGGQLGSSTF